MASALCARVVADRVPGIYADPADLLVVKEIDWEHPPEELAEAVRRSLMARLVAILSGRDWRAGRPYQAHPKRTTGRRWERHAKSSTPKPLDIDAGDWEELRERILARSTMEETELQGRYERFVEEVQAKDEADIIVSNRAGEIAAAQQHFREVVRDKIQTVKQ